MVVYIYIYELKEYSVVCVMKDQYIGYYCKSLFKSVGSFLLVFYLTFSTVDYRLLK